VYVGQARIRRNIGKILRIAREKMNLSLDQVVAKLNLSGISCSKSNLARIELDETSCRVDIFAGLALIYKIKFEDVVYIKKDY